MTALSDTSPAVIDGGDGVPPEPNWTKLFKTIADREVASEIWQSVVGEMKSAGTLAVVNGRAIKRYVLFSIEFERQARAIATGGVIRKAPKTKVPMVSPGWTIMKQAAEAAAALETELGISPRRRNSAGKVERKAGSVGRAADRFLKRVS